MYRFAEVEAALASMHHVTPEMLGFFQARLKNFRKLGLVPTSPGKGIKISYTFDDAARWAFCFELTEIGLDPSTVRNAYTDSRDTALSCMRAHDHADETVMFFNLSLLSQWEKQEVGSGFVPFQTCKLSEATFERMSSGWTGFLAPSPTIARVVAVNLTRIGRDLKAALAEQYARRSQGGVFG